MGDYYKLVGTEVVPCSLLEWGVAFGKTRIGRYANREVIVSTVFLGMDHGYPPDPTRPVVFETRVSGGPLDGSQGRYPTYEAAIKGHNEWVKLVKPKYCVWSIIKGVTGNDSR